MLHRVPLTVNIAALQDIHYHADLAKIDVFVVAVKCYGVAASRSEGTAGSTGTFAHQKAVRALVRSVPGAK